MMPKIKNIIIFVAIGLALVAVYFFFIRKPAETPLVSSSASGPLGSSSTNSEPSASKGAGSDKANGYLLLLLSIKDMSLKADILADPSFLVLRDSTQDFTSAEARHGRVNPFAPIDSEGDRDTISALNSINTSSEVESGNGTVTESTAVNRPSFPQ